MLRKQFGVGAILVVALWWADAKPAVTLNRYFKV
jgi:hypothetical protein